MREMEKHRPEIFADPGEFGMGVTYLVGAAETPGPSRTCLACSSPRTRPFGASVQLRECMVCGTVWSSAGIVLRPQIGIDRAARGVEMDRMIDADHGGFVRAIGNVLIGALVVVGIVVALLLAWSAIE